MKSSAFVFVTSILFFVTPLFAEKPSLPSPVVPDGLGYNIHFTDAKPGEMEMLAESGATMVRMDFGWNGTEREKGVYDFQAFDRLTNSLEKHKIRPLYILDYSNRHYDGGLSPYSEEGRRAFAKWAAAGAVHFQGRGILWEMYNEPNIGFWKPKPNPDDYIKLALEVGKALREAAPAELYIGPATSGINFDFLEKCFNAGLLEYWDAVSVHPYRQKAPETVVKEYAKLRYMIDKYAPKGKKIPILSAEWGYSSVWHNFNDDIQGRYLPRQWMINLACDVPVSIWYDWHDDGTDPKEPEHHFGTTNNAYKKDQTPTYDPKPAYIAAKTFTETFRGFRYNKRIGVGPPGILSDNVHVFLFDKGDEIRLACWTTAKEADFISIPCDSAKFKAVSHLGKKLPDIVAENGCLKFEISEGPVYLIPEKPDGFWSEVAKLESVPLFEYRYKIGAERFIGSSSDEKIDIVRKERITQGRIVRTANPVNLGMPIPVGNNLVLSVDNPSGEALSVQNIVISHPKGIELGETIRALELKQGQRTASLSFPIKTKPTGKYEFCVSIQSRDFSPMPVRTMRLIDDFSQRSTESLNAAWRIFPDGDAKIGSEQSIEMTEADLVKITYRFDAGWKFVRLAPKDAALRKIDGSPKELGVRIDGDGSGNSVRLRFTDATGQTFQVHGGTMPEKKTYFFSFPLDGVGAGHWGGANDGKVTYPIRFDSLLIDGQRKACGPYSVTVSSMVLIDAE